MMQLYDVPQVALALLRIHATVSAFVYLLWALALDLGPIFGVSSLDLTAKVENSFVAAAKSGVVVSSDTLY